MESRELERRRGWPWKSRKNLNGLSSGSDGSSPAPVKLFDEQEVARILQDQVRIGDEQMVEALQTAEAKHSEKEKALSEKLAAANEKLTSVLAEITVKDNLVKQHIKVAEEAVVGWEKAENEAAEFKSDLDNAIQQRLATEDRAKHLDGALKELMQQLRGGREEHDKHLHETIVKKTREFDKLRLETESKLAEVSKSLSDNRTQLIESQAENEALNHALKDRSRMIAELNEIRAHAETDSKILRVRLEGLEKENFDLKYKVHSITKELDIRSAELEYGKKTSDVLSRHHADSVKKIVKLEDECNRLRMMVRKKLPNPAAIIRMKQELDSLGKAAGEVSSTSRTRRRPLFRSQSGGVDFLPIHELLVQEEAHQDLVRETNYAAAERIANMDGETRMLKEALAKRNDELQASRLMCAKTASRLTAVEDELQSLKAASPELTHSNDDASSACSESLCKRAPLKNGTQKSDLMNSFVERERLAHARSHSESRLAGFGGHTQELAATVMDSPVTNSEFQQQIVGFENALAAKNRDLTVANQMCEELSKKLKVAENQFSALQSRNAANEQSVIVLQDRLDKLLECQENAKEHLLKAADAAPEMSALQRQLELSTAVKSVFQATEALAQALQVESPPHSVVEDADTTGSIVRSLRWQEPKLENCMASLALVANNLPESESEIHSVIKFTLELSSTLACLTGLSSGVIKDVQTDREAVCMDLESAKAEVSQLEEALAKIQKERAALEIQTQVELDRVSGLEKEIDKLQTEKAQVEPQLHETNNRVEALRDQLKEAETLIAELRLLQDQQKQEDELIEEELLELSSSHPGLAKTMRAADAEMNELHVKLAALEAELHGERRRHHDVVAKLEDLQEQIHRGVGRSISNSGSYNNKEFSQPFMGEDDASKSARQEREIAAAALAECQRTILALGKQLKILGFSESRELTVDATDSPDSIKRMTETMEFLRWQTESGDQGPPRQRTKSSTSESITDGPVSVPASPARSDCLEPPSTPESPATSTVRRSVRTIRPFQLPKAPASNGNGHGDVMISDPNDVSLEPSKTASTYTRFHARSPSESSNGSNESGHSNGIS